jgi:hypothetical protein
MTSATTIVSISNAYKEEVLLAPEGLCSPKVFGCNQNLKHDQLLSEIIDVDTMWPSYWANYAKAATLPMLIAPRVLSEENVRLFRGGF